MLVTMLCNLHRLGFYHSSEDASGVDAMPLTGKIDLETASLLW